MADSAYFDVLQSFPGRDTMEWTVLQVSSVALAVVTACFAGVPLTFERPLAYPYYTFLCFILCFHFRSPTAR